MLSPLDTSLALTFSRYIAQAQARANQAATRIASGNRINSAADDPSGLAEATRLTSQVNEAGFLARNSFAARDEASLVDGEQTSALSTLQAMRTAVLAMNSSDPGSVSVTQSAVSSYNYTLTQLAKLTDPSGRALLDGSFSASYLVADPATSSPTLTIAPASVDPSALGSSSLTLANIDLTTGSAATNQTNALAAIDAAISSVSSSEATTGALSNVAGINAEFQNSVVTTLSDSRNRTMSADIPTETASLAAAQSQVAMASQIFQLWIQNQTTLYKNLFGES